MNALSNGITIEVEENGKKYHTLDDWGFALGNNNYIGEPEAETSYISIPGRNGMLDVSNAITGRTTYKKRELSFSLGGIRERNSWDSIISDIRNKINGKICRIILDNDETFFWKGRVFVEDFDRMRDLGQFKLSVPDADPYKYNVDTSADPWKWDPFNFLNGIITFMSEIHISGSGSVDIASGNMYVSPEFVVENMESQTFTVTYKGKTYSLSEGTTRIPPILVNGAEKVTLTFTGTADVSVIYRGGSL